MSSTCACRCQVGRRGHEAAEGHGVRVRRREEGSSSRQVDGEEGGAVAVRAVHDGGTPVRGRRLRQEGAAQLRPGHQRPGGDGAEPGRGAVYPHV